MSAHLVEHATALCLALPTSSKIALKKAYEGLAAARSCGLLKVAGEKPTARIAIASVASGMRQLL